MSAVSVLCPWLWPGGGCSSFPWLWLRHCLSWVGMAKGRETGCQGHCGTAVLLNSQFTQVFQMESSQGFPGFSPSPRTLESLSLHSCGFNTACTTVLSSKSSHLRFESSLKVYIECSLKLPDFRKLQLKIQSEPFGLPSLPDPKHCGHWTLECLICKQFSKVAAYTWKILEVDVSLNDSWSSLRAP